MNTETKTAGEKVGKWAGENCASSHFPALPTFPPARLAHLLTCGLFLLLLTCSLHAQSTLTPGVPLNSGAVKSNWVASTTKLAWRSVIVNNVSATDYWILVFDSATNKLNNAAVEIPAFKVTAGTTGYFDPPSGPIQFNRGLNVVASTTPVTLTNDATAAVVITVIRNP